MVKKFTLYKQQIIKSRTFAPAPAIRPEFKNYHEPI